MDVAKNEIHVAHPKTAIVTTCILAALAGLMFGLDVGVISGATQFIQAEFKVTDSVIEWIVSAMMGGAAGFAMMVVGLGSVGTMMNLGIASHGQQILTVGMLLFFIVGFAMSAGPLIWALCAEVQPLKGRDFGIACSTFTNWIVNMIVGATFLSLLNGIGNAHTFWLYAAFNAVFIVFTFWLVPETKNVTLEQIERNLMSGKPLRNIGQ
ncbi:MFS transporter [Luteibacter sp.]|jgi:MFS family permease|uniref:MFS transporter n=1 Tax=Luteibacter sp. TaxID=1886636 RepID=UPI0031F30D05